jgi:rare lipoprotein A
MMKLLPKSGVNGAEAKLLNLLDAMALHGARWTCLFAAGLGATLIQPLPLIARPVTATVYATEFHGRTTYCGGIYEHWGISAAHPWLPCGTPVRVSHRGRTLTVRVTDRCDCGSIDLSAGAAYRLGVPLDGIATVRISHP